VTSHLVPLVLFLPIECPPLTPLSWACQLANDKFLPEKLLNFAQPLEAIVCVIALLIFKWAYIILQYLIIEISFLKLCVGRKILQQKTLSVGK